MYYGDGVTGVAHPEPSTLSIVYILAYLCMIIPSLSKVVL